MRRVVLSLIVAGLLLALLAAPALAINDGRVPADECSGNPNAVGTPGGMPNPGLSPTGPSPVEPPASVNNPGQDNSFGDTGAEGQERSSAVGNCAAT